MMCLPKQIVIHLVYTVCLRMNVFPLKGGLSMDYPPRELVTQRSVSYKKYCRAEFGSYIEASIDAMVKNNQIPRRHDCIAFFPSGNRQGTFKCYDFKTGSVVTRGVFDVLPIPDRIFKQVNVWGMKSKKEIRKIK